MSLKHEITPQDIIEITMWTLLELHTEPDDADVNSCAAAAVKVLIERGWLKSAP